MKSILLLLVFLQKKTKSWWWLLPCFCDYKKDWKYYVKKHQAKLKNETNFTKDLRQTGNVFLHITHAKKIRSKKKWSTPKHERSKCANNLVVNTKNGEQNSKRCNSWIFKSECMSCVVLDHNARDACFTLFWFFSSLIISTFNYLKRCLLCSRSRLMTLLYCCVRAFGSL